MKAKEFIQLFVPPIYYKVKQRLFPKKQPKINPLPKVAHDRQRAIVIGNGPSLNRTMELYEHQLHDADCIMVNYSALTPLFEQIKPTYYVMIDPDWVKGLKIYEETDHKCIQALVEKTKWPMKMVLPSYFKTWWAIDELKKNPNITILYDESRWEEKPEEELFPAFEANRISPPSYTVLTYAVYIALYFDYAETFIVGADTSFMRDMYVGKDNVLYTIDTHYYNNQEVCPEDLDPEKHGRPFRSTVEKKLYELYLVFCEYRLMSNYAKWRGLKLYNASEFSMIDSIERKKLK